MHLSIFLNLKKQSAVSQMKMVITREEKQILTLQNEARFEKVNHVFHNKSIYSKKLDGITNPKNGDFFVIPIGEGIYQEIFGKPNLRQPGKEP